MDIKRKVVIEYAGKKISIIPLRLEFNVADHADTWSLLAYDLDAKEFAVYDMGFVRRWRRA